MLAGGGTKVSWLGKTLSHCAYPKLRCMHELFILTRRPLIAKLGAMFGRLNLIAKPSHIFNADEMGVSIVHRPSKVVAQIGRHNVPSLTSADKGKTHTILACVSASGQVIFPFIVYPRKNLFLRR